MIQQHHQYDFTSDDLNTKFNTSLTECVKQQLNSRTCSDFDLHSLSYTISPSVDHHSFSYYSSSQNSLRNFNTPAYSYVSENILNNNNLMPSHSSLTYSPIIDRTNDKNYLNKLKRKQLFVNNRSEMQCNQTKMINSNQKLSNSAYFDPESLVSFTLQSNVKKSINSKSTPCLNNSQQTSPQTNNELNDQNKTPKNKRKTTINWPFRRSNSSSTVKQQQQQQQQNSPVPLSIQQHKNKTVTMFHKKLLSKSQSNLKSNKSPKSTTLSIMSNVTLKRSNKKQTIKLFGQSINKLYLGDRHLIAPVKNMLIELMQRGPSTIGIFRKSPNARTQRELKAELEQNPDCNLSEYPILAIASVFKELLRSLPDSLLVDKIYMKWLRVAKIIDESSKNTDCSQFIRPLIKSLPKANYLLLQHFLCILHYIAMQSNENKMNAENLAVCIGPSLLKDNLVLTTKDCEASKQVPKLISYLIENCVDLFGANTLTLFEPYLNKNKVSEMENMINENKENELKEKNMNKDSGAEEESDSLNSLNELNNNINCKKSNEQILNNQIHTNLFIKDHNLHQPQSPTSSSSINTFSSTSSFNSSTNNSTSSTPKIYQQQQLNKEKINSCSNSSTASSSENNNNNLRLPSNSVHQSYYVPMLGQQTPVNKVSLSNLSRDSGLTLSDTQLYSPEEDDDEDDYHHIINQHLHLNKKLNSIVSDKCLSNKNQFKINSANKKITTNSTSLKKKCNKINTRINATSSEEDDIELDDDLSEKSCASENCAPLYSRVYHKHNQISDHLLTKSAPQLANIETINQSIIKETKNDLINQNKTTMPLYLNSIKDNSLSTNSTTNSSCNSPSSASLNLSSSNEYSPSELHYTSTPISNNNNLKDDLFKNKPPHIVMISAKANTNLIVNNQNSTNANVCNVSINNLNDGSKKALSTLPLNINTKLSKSTPPSYQETMNRKEINARMTQSNLNNTSRKICSSEIDNLISQKIYEQSLRVYNSDAHKDLKLRAIPAKVKSQTSSDSDSDYENQFCKNNFKGNSLMKTTTNRCSSNDQVDGLVAQVKCKPLVQQTCAKYDTEYWKKDVNWSVATLRKKYTELCEQKKENSSYSPVKTINRNSIQVPSQKTNITSSYKSTSSIYDLCKKEKDKTKLNNNCLSKSSHLFDNKNGVTIIQIIHGKSNKSTDSLSGEESYV